MFLRNRPVSESELSLQQSWQKQTHPADEYVLVATLCKVRDELSYALGVVSFAVRSSPKEGWVSGE